MPLVLTIENPASLPKGLPAHIEIPKDGQLSIGRYHESDWVLPDPSRFISGRHCEIRYQDGCYWLYDVSTNGTFMNGGTSRIDSPKPLRPGDRLAIGIYVVTVTILPDTDALSPAKETTRLAMGRTLNNIFRQTVTTHPR
jgi:type VI secretion system protein ImpI